MGDSSDSNQGVRIGRISIEAPGTDTVEAKRMARRIAGLLGTSLAGGVAIQPRREAIVDVAVPVGLSGERLAEFVVTEIQRQLR